jgi:hypothetical protein
MTRAKGRPRGPQIIPVKTHAQVDAERRAAAKAVRKLARVNRKRWRGLLR